MNGSGSADTFKNIVKKVITVFQIIALIYFVKGLHGIKAVSEGASKEGLGKAMLTIIASALVIDLPHTIEMIQSTVTIITGTWSVL